MGKHVVLAMHSGSYGRTDDVCGALILANALLTHGMAVTVLLKGDGVFVALPGQDPNNIGYEPHLMYMEAVAEMGARIVAVEESMRERGLGKDQVLDYIEFVEEKDLPGLMAEADHWVPF
jgi:sulfur relay (sulfurtransferase) DsrF/TusC family protein